MGFVDELRQEHDDRIKASKARALEYHRQCGPEVAKSFEHRFGTRPEKVYGKIVRHDGLTFKATKDNYHSSWWSFCLRCRCSCGRWEWSFPISSRMVLQSVLFRNRPVCNGHRD